jgi:hypothetical protein
VVPTLIRKVRKEGRGIEGRRARMLRVNRLSLLKSRIVRLMTSSKVELNLFLDVRNGFINMLRNFRHAISLRSLT